MQKLVRWPKIGLTNGVGRVGWVFLLAFALGGRSAADEGLRPVSLSETTWSGYVDTSAGWRLGSPLSSGAGPTISAPYITQVRVEASEIVITAWVPPGQHQLTLECRPRMGPGSWTPEARQQLNGQESEVTFRLPNRRALELIRVRAEALSDLPLPVAFYNGKSQFSPTLGTNLGWVDGLGGGQPPETAGPLLPDGATSLPSNEPGPSVRLVAESDLWQIDGPTIYFFNQGRGLQVVDVSEPDAPRLTSYLPVGARGEQMYLLPTKGPAGEKQVALLLSSGCSEGGEVLVVRINSQGQADVVHHLPFQGQVRESRLVGSVLYLVSYWWHATTPLEATNTGGAPAPVPAAWQGDTLITAHNLAAPDLPEAKPSTMTLAANPTAVVATDEFLFIAETAPLVWQPEGGYLAPGTNTLEVIDISDVTGVLRRLGPLTTRGVVGDKFKISLAGDVVRVASFRGPGGALFTGTNWYSLSDGGFAFTTGPRLEKYGESWRSAPPMDPSAYRTEVFSTWESYPAQSWLETFSLSGLQAPTKLGELLVREGEQLYATRFAGDRAYVVTFRRTDPLILVDLSNPAQPTIRGELQVPGYSTDLLPLSNSRLLAMGLENGQPTVSLFDSSDVTRPSLLSKVLLSTTNGWSYSEANTDEKAFSYFPESGLILFPWQGWTNGVSFQTVQLLDLRQDVLTRRGVIPQATIARRATVIGQRVYSISASELLSIDVADRDRPDLRATLPLLYPVEQVFVLGNRLVEIAEEVGFDAASTRPMIKLALQTSPEVPTGTLALPAGLRSLGFFLHGTQLHVLQQDAPTYRLELTLVTNELQQPVSSPATTGLLSEGLMGVTYGSQPSSDGQTAFQVVTNAQYIAVPGPLVASIIDCSGPSPRILGQTRREGISISFASQLTALVVAPDILVWTDVRSTWAGSWGPPVPAPLPMGMGGAANPTGVFPGPMVRWADGAWTAGSWGRWGGTSGAHFLPINFSTETRPQMGNLISVGTNSSWTVTSGAFAADGQIFFSHETTKYFPSPQLDTHAEWAAVTPALFTGWETRHQLEVVNLSDPADPVFRDPLDLPGPLMGLSHFGALLYTRGSATSGSESGHQLQALAYDGLKVSLVDEIGLAGVIAFSLRTDGVALVAQSGTTNRPAMIASWAVASDGHWQAYAEVPLVGRPAISLHAYSDGLVVAERGGGEFLFLKSNARDSLLPLGIFEGDCGLFPDWSKADATIPAGLWLPRGPYGLWPIWGQSVPNPP